MMKYYDGLITEDDISSITNVKAVDDFNEDEEMKSLTGGAAAGGAAGAAGGGAAGAAQR